MGKAQKQKHGPRKKSQGARIVNWAAALGVLALIVYGFTQMSSIAYDDDDIRVVNFSGLDPERKTTVLEAANRARCNCGCGLGLAQCVSTDPECPVREDNIELIRGMVRTAMTSKPPS